MNETQRPETLNISQADWEKLPTEVKQVVGAIQSNIKTLQEASIRPSRRRVSAVIGLAAVLIAAVGLGLGILNLLSIQRLEAAVVALQNPPPIAATIIAPQTPRERFSSSQNFVVYYGKGQREALTQFDIAIIQPETLSDEDLLALTASDTLTLAYLSIGEVEPSRPWYSDGSIQQDWILGQNPNWGSYYVDARQEGWQMLVERLAGQYIAKGFHGIFLDTVDTVDLFPDTAQGMTDMILGLRAAFPNAIFVQNRGFAVLDRTADVVDGVMFESLTTGYDFANKTYLRRELSESQPILDQLQTLRQTNNFLVLVLDYAPQDDAETIARAREAAHQLGYLSSVSEITLQTIYSTPAPTATP